MGYLFVKAQLSSRIKQDREPAMTQTNSNNNINSIRRVAILTTGRVNPAISPVVGFLLRRYQEVAPDVKIICYQHGFRGLLTNDKIVCGKAEFDAAQLITTKGGSPIGSSRVRLTNKDHLVRDKLIRDENEDPIRIAAQQLVLDQIDVLHAVGSANTQFTSDQLAKCCREQFNHRLTIVGIPKTIENDLSGIHMTLGAASAAIAGARFFGNVVAEHGSNPRMLIIHEIKGRAAGWLTAATAYAYRQSLDGMEFAPCLNLHKSTYDVHAVYVPEMTNVDWNSEITRLRRVMDHTDNVCIFVSQGAFAKEIEEEVRKTGGTTKQHANLGYAIPEPAKWLAKKLKNAIRAEKVLIQRSGIYVRAGTAARQDLVLAQSTANTAVAAALHRKDGVIGHDLAKGGRLHPIEHSRVTSGKPFDLATPWFASLLSAIGQPQNISVEMKLPLFAKL